MSAFKQNTRKLGIRAGLLAGASAAVLAIAGISAGSAMAGPTCPEAASVSAEGSSLQKTAQEGWKTSYNTTCASKPASVTYGSTSSLAALEGWGAFNGTTQPHTHQFIATDEPPEATEITNIKKAAGSGSHVQIIPVAQAAIAIVVNTPGTSGTCSLPEIKYGQLEEIYAGKLTAWGSVSNTTGTCSGTISHVVREDKSGTTYILKSFFNKVSAAAKECPALTWSELAKFENNLVWPGGTGSQEAGCPAPATKSGGSGGGSVLTKVAATDGSFGYVDLATVKNSSQFKNGEVAIVKVQDSTTAYASPQVANNAKGEEVKEANCVGTVYTVPSGASTGEASDVLWTGAGGPNTAPGGGRYPICALTYDVAFHDYSEAGFGSAFGEVVKDYLLRQVVEGQTQLEGDYYAPLPSTVLSAAKYTAGKISN